MHLYFLGTGAGLPSTERNVTAIALCLFDERGSYWLFDCGEGTQQQMLLSPLSTARLEKLWVTHLHGDHVFGIPGLLSSKSFHGSSRPLTLFGPSGLVSYLDCVMHVCHTHLSYPFEMHEIVTCDENIYADATFSVRTLPLKHVVPSYGYRIMEADKPGALDVVRLRELGVAEGPLFGKLKRGESITLENGQVVAAADVIGPPIPGRRVAILGDTALCDNAIALADGVDVLVHEATFRSDLAQTAAQFGHSTAHDAAHVARRAGARQLILTHISARYPGDAAHELLAEAREIFPETYLAHDHARFDIPRRKASF